MVLEIPATVVNLESGTTATVEPFRVMKNCVTVAEYDEFCRQARYQTTAEQNEDFANFRDNYAIEDLSAHDRAATVAYLLSWYDAAAYCEWKRGRLITETEWLAASVLKWDRIQPLPVEKLFNEQWEASKSAHQMYIAGPEWTSKLTSDGLSCVRSWPRYFLTQGWNDDPVQKNSKALARDFYNDVISFRLCFACTRNQ